MPTPPRPLPITRELLARLLLFATLPITVGSHCFAQDNSITWGPSDAGLRLGVTTETANLRLVLNNIGSTSLTVFVAMNSGTGIGYLFQFTADAVDGTQYKIWDMRPESIAPVAGLLIPQTVSLAPGATREFVFPLKHLVYMSKGRNISLDSLLQQGYTLHASLEVQQKNLDGASMGGIPPPAIGRLWTGRVSCSFRWLKPKPPKY